MTQGKTTSQQLRRKREGRGKERKTEKRENPGNITHFRFLILLIGVILNLSEDKKFLIKILKKPWVIGLNSVQLGGHMTQMNRFNRKSYIKDYLRKK